MGNGMKLILRDNCPICEIKKSEVEALIKLKCEGEK